MREFAKVAPQFWTGKTGKRIRQLGRECQVISAYLITCPSANALGLYYLPIPTLSHETGINPRGALKALRSLSEAGFCFYDASSEWVFVPNMARFQVGDRLELKDNQVKWIRREIETLIKAPFFNDFLNLYRDAFHLQEVSPSEAPSDTLRSQEIETETEIEIERENKKPRSQARSKPDFEIWFESEFLNAYPEHRRVQETTAIAELRKIKPDVAARSSIMARLLAWKVSDAWTKDRGEYVPGMGKFFKDGWYKREPQAPTRNGGNGSLVAASDYWNQVEK